MLHFLTMADNKGPIRRYLRHWGAALRGRTRILSYASIDDAASLADGTYIFGDVDRMSMAELDQAAALWRSLAARGSRVRLLNEPGVALRRKPLLKALYRAKINRFDVHGLDEPRDAIRYPVFLRSSTQHLGAFSGLLRDPTELDAAIRGLIAAGKDAEDLLIVEFVDTLRDGLYRKYSLIRAGDALLPHHIFFDEDWMVKGAYFIPLERQIEDLAFLESGLHPDGQSHIDTLRQVFDIARIGFGRVDYGFDGERLQIWEINTVPNLLIRRKFYNALQKPKKAAFAGRLNHALAALDDTGAKADLADRVSSVIDLWR